MAIQGDWLVVALMIDGHLCSLEHASRDNPEALARRHLAVTTAAHQQGMTWVIEIVDPSGRMPATRLSNDPAEPLAAVKLTQEAVERWMDRIVS